MKPNHTQNLLPVIRKIHVFQGLALSEARRLLRLCECRSYEAKRQIYTYGEPSTEMLILLKGKLVATAQSGRLLGEILPGTCTGEMGVFTGEARSAGVAAAEDSLGFVIRKPGLDTMLRMDRGMHLKILQNIVAQLCDRLASLNRRLEYTPAAGQTAVPARA
jgi:CRP-like cAMP-binding protein